MLLYEQLDNYVRDYVDKYVYKVIWQNNLLISLGSIIYLLYSNKLFE